MRIVFNHLSKSSDKKLFVCDSESVVHILEQIEFKSKLLKNIIKQFKKSNHIFSKFSSKSEIIYINDRKIIPNIEYIVKEYSKNNKSVVSNPEEVKAEFLKLLYQKNWGSDGIQNQFILNYIKSNSVDIFLNSSQISKFNQKYEKEMEKNMNLEFREFYKNLDWILDSKVSLNKFNLDLINPNNIQIQDNANPFMFSFNFVQMKECLDLQNNVSKSEQNKEQDIPKIITHLKDSKMEGLTLMSLQQQKKFLSLLPFGHLQQDKYNCNIHVRYVSRYIVEKATQKVTDICSIFYILAELCKEPFRNKKQQQDQVSIKEMVLEIFSRIKFFFNVSNDSLFNLDRKLSSSMFNLICKYFTFVLMEFIYCIRVVFIEMIQMYKQKEDVNQLEIEIEGSDTGTWAESIWKQLISFIKQYLLIWTNKKIFHKDFILGFERETIYQKEFIQFQNNMKNKNFINMINSTFFLDWISFQKRMQDKIKDQGLYLSQKYFILPELLPSSLCQMFFCKIKKFETESSQMKNEIMIKTRDSISILNNKNKEKFWKESLLKTAHPQNYLTYLDTTCSLLKKREFEFLDNQTDLLEKFLYEVDFVQQQNTNNKKSKKNALKKIDSMMNYSNRMENNIQNLNIKHVLEQELNEDQQNILELNSLEKFLFDKYSGLFGKLDRNFLAKLKKS